MKKLFIANATSRNHHLHYRIPGEVRIYDAVIDAGTQYAIPSQHCLPEVIEHIVKQIEGCGAVHRSKAQREDGKRFSGLIFSETPLSIEAIQNGFSEVEQSAIDAALQEHQRAAIAADDKVAKLAQDAGTGVGSVEVEIIEQQKPGADANDLNKSLIQVQRQGRPVSERSQRKAREARA